MFGVYRKIGVVPFQAPPRVIHVRGSLRSISTRYVKTEAAIAIGKGIAGVWNWKKFKHYLTFKISSYHWTVAFVSFGRFGVQLVGEEHSLNVASGGVEDVKGNPADKSKTGGWFAASIILGVELSERMCIVGISSNLVTYLVGRLHISNADSANIVTNFMGTLYILCLFGGFISDSLLGRYRTIAIFATILALGVSLLAFSTSLPSLQPPPCTGNHRYCIPASGKMLAMLYASLYITAFGVGGVKSNVSGFGSDQFDNEDPKERKKMIYFFNRFYFCISLGSLFAVSVLVYIQDYVGRGWGYGISAGSTVLAVSLFLAGSSKFRYRKPAGSPITRISQVLVAAWRNRKQSLPSDSSLLNQDRYAHPMEPAKRRILHTDQFLWLDKAAILVDPLSMNGNGAEQSPWKTATIGRVEEVKMVIRLLPIWSTGIMFWTVYSQMTTFSVEQANTMDRKIGPFKIPSASLACVLVGSIMFFTTLSEKVLVPWTRRLSGRMEGISSLQRICVGLVLSMVAMLAAALVEAKRLHVAKQHGLTDKPRATVPVSVFWLAPQFFLEGSADRLAQQTDKPPTNSQENIAAAALKVECLVLFRFVVEWSVFFDLVDCEGDRNLQVTGPSTFNLPLCSTVI
eukprot:Gb_32315 [translate_table: standard]